MPGGLNVPLDPFLNGGNIGGGVLQVFADIFDLGGTDHGGLRGAARLGLDGPAAMLNSRGNVVGAAVGLGVLKIEVLRGGGAVKGVEPGIVVSISATGRCFEQGQRAWAEGLKVEGWKRRTHGCIPVTSPAKASIRRAVSRDLM